MGPQKAALVFLDRHPDAKAFEVTLYGSLAATGKGHLTDQAIVEVLSCARRDCVESQRGVALPHQWDALQVVQREW